MSAEVIDMAQARFFRPAVVALQFARMIFDVAVLQFQLGRCSADAVVKAHAELKTTARAAEIVIAAWEKRRAA